MAMPSWPGVPTLPSVPVVEPGVPWLDREGIARDDSSAGLLACSSSSTGTSNAALSPLQSGYSLFPKKAQSKDNGSEPHPLEVKGKPASSESERIFFFTI